MTKRGRLVIIFFLIIGAFVLVKNRVGKKEKGKKEKRKIFVQIVEVKKRSFLEEIEAIGEIEPFKKVVIYSEATGKVEKLNFDQGDYVKKGDLIALIDYEKRKLRVKQIESEIKSVETEIKNLKKNYERFKRLFEKKVISEKKLDDIKTSYNSALYKLDSLKTQLEVAKVNLKDTEITSPINGFIAKKFVDEGEIITESTMAKNSPIVAIVDISKVRVKLPVAEEEIGKVKEGQKVIIMVDAYPEEKFYGRVNKIFPVADLSTRTVGVEVLIENPSFKIKPGMFVKAKIITGRKTFLALPMDALLKLPVSGSYYCFRYKNGIVEKVYVKIGKRYGNYVEIRKGLKEKDKIIVSSLGVLNPGEKVFLKGGI